ncbi:hypothetical protein SH580_08785 [Coraliomargarita algicola]|uniref:Uncharacterized protein n=1 Tax=Coraliomargarita algicola TaxID=3092156 RepID=A0ABZ0RRT9_9BACT|nr:hypothetical protein [Coraliomargarita sp. J2-16]WPJ97806.1 hypothetical protein SH580_08785 [Coraliomargarita sp. J2-16]
MSHPAKTLNQVSTEAHQVLCERLGVADTVRFLNQFKNGKGNYTKERDATLEDMSVQEAAAAIRKSKEAKNTNITT